MANPALQLGNGKRCHYAVTLGYRVVAPLAAARESRLPGQWQEHTYQVEVSKIIAYNQLIVSISLAGLQR